MFKQIATYTGSKEYIEYELLYKAIEKGNLHLTKSILQQDPNAVRAIVSLHKDTALHIAILVGRMKIAEHLVKMMGPEDLEMVNEYGSTALTLAAIGGVTKLAKALVEKNRKLVIMENEHEDGQLPVIVAALYGQKQMVHYLYRVTPKEVLSPERGQRGVTLLNSLITAEIYGKIIDVIRIIPIHTACASLTPAFELLQMLLYCYFNDIQNSVSPLIRVVITLLGYWLTSHLHFLVELNLFSGNDGSIHVSILLPILS